MTSKARTLTTNLCLLVLGAAVFIPGTGGVRLFDWDEINFAESAREMLVTGDWFNVRINFESFWEKPPLFIWLQALSMKAFGVGEAAARFPNAVAGILTLLLLFNIGQKARDYRFGLLWAGMYLMSFLPFFYFKSGIIDPWFNLFIFLGIYFFSLYSDSSQEGARMRNALLSGASIGLGILTKGPVALLVFGLTFIAFISFNRFRLNFRWRDVAAYLAALCLVGGSWFIALALTGHREVIHDFIQYQVRLFETKDAGHGGFLLYHFVWLFFGVTPASIFALQAFRPSILKSEDNPSLSNLFKWMILSFWVVLILFTIVNTKIVHYSSFCYFPLTFLAAYAADRMIDGRMEWKKWQSALLIAISAIYGAIFTVLTLFDRIKHLIIPLIDDPFAVKCLQAQSEWVGFEPAAGLVLIAATVIFCIAFRRRRKMRSLAVLAAGNVFFLLTTMICAVGEVEKYTQASAVDFFISHKGEDCYICPVNYKSYAQYFYSDRQIANTCEDYSYLSEADLDKDCYFVLKDYDGDIALFLERTPDAVHLYSRSGFAFFVRHKAGEALPAEQGESQDGQIE